MPPLKAAFKKLPQPVQETTKGAIRRLISPYGRARLGAGIEPLSYTWGSDRGTEIARHYVEEEFLKEFSGDVRGHVMEFFGDDYIVRYGGKKVSKVDILNLEEGNEKATIIGQDLTKPNTIPSNAFDCVICTHVLHVIYDFDAAIADLYRILKPGGVLLIAVPLVSMCDPAWHELWRFTREGLQLALEKSFKKSDVTMRFYGNSLTAAGQLRGLVAHEFSTRTLKKHDERFAVEICGRAVK
ncbi:MAG: methyltransferase domain-containing protein [Steroidobacteraceae bacterium]